MLSARDGHTWAPDSREDVAGTGGDPLAAALLVHDLVRLWNSAMDGADPERVSMENEPLDLLGMRIRVGDDRRRGNAKICHAARKRIDTRSAVARVEVEERQQRAVRLAVAEAEDKSSCACLFPPSSYGSLIDAGGCFAQRLVCRNWRAATLSLLLLYHSSARLRDSEVSEVRTREH